MADEINLTLRNTRRTQLNERVSETQYDILHPETDANVVITNTEKQFVSQTEKDKWNATIGAAHFRGLWNIDADYQVGDIVRNSDGYYFEAITSHKGQTPDPTQRLTTVGSVVYWSNMNLIAYHAINGDNIKTNTTATAKDFYLTFVNDNNAVGSTNYEAVYTDTGIKYNPGTNTLTVEAHADGSANIIGKVTEAVHAETADRATEADHATDADHADNADLAEVAKNYYIEDGNTPNIHETFEGIKETIRDIISVEAGAILSNKLYLQLNGAALNPTGFDGSAEQTVNFEITPQTVTGLLNNQNKIDSRWLSDSMLGNLRYGGTINELGIITSTESKYNGKNINDIPAADNVGVYFLAAYTNANAAPTLAGVGDVRVGDWLVSNGAAGWVKVDNTDAVTMVNNQIGAVETYKGTWTTNTQYFRGDIVKYNGALYIANAESNTTTFPESLFDIFGRVYTASAGIKLVGNDFQHDVTKEAGSNTNANLNYGESFVVPSVTTDGYGHVTKVDLKTLTMPAATIDTWRPINVNGVEVLTNSITGNDLSFVDGVKTKVVYENDAVKIDHEETGYDAGSVTLEKVDAVGTGETNLLMGNGFTVPTFEYDAYGHVSNVQKKTYRLPSSVVDHKHFEVTTVNNVATIGAYAAERATSSWVASSTNAGKFYLGETLPIATTRMNYNGNFVAKNLYQVTNNVLERVLDTGVKINGGLKLDGSNIESTFNSATNTITLGDSGVATGVYSAVSVNSKGLVTAGGNILEFGAEVGDNPTAALAIGGLFFRRIA